MSITKNLINKYSNLQTVFKSFFLLIILFLTFFAVNLFITIQNKHESAYNALNHKDKEQIDILSQKIYKIFEGMDSDKEIDLMLAALKECSSNYIEGYNLKTAQKNNQEIETKSKWHQLQKK